MPRTVCLLALILMVLGLGGCGRPPSIGEDKDAFKAVDALYTAVSMREQKLLDQCDASLKSLHDSGKVPDNAFESLESITAEARAGKWETAQERLTKFMEGQRR
ncbi:MAG: hypothetical protein JWN86_4688 [Planctomycetota bacterium]|nr:hypothetical protein [Planctomycetota bacterium]